MRWWKRMRKAMEFVWLAENLQAQWPAVRNEMEKNHPGFAATVQDIVDLFHRDRGLWRR